MRVASRHMPMPVARRVGLVGKLLIACFIAGVAYFAVVRPQETLLVSGGLGLLFWLARLHGTQKGKKLLVLACQREGQTICEFARDFDARAVDTWVIRAVYERMQAQLQHVHRSFPVRADDRLKEDLLLDEDDLELELAPDIAARTGRTTAGSTHNPFFGNVRTARDLVLFFNCQAKSSSAT